MKAKELAAKLNGREYGDEMTDAESKQAKRDGLLVAFGYSDDNLELRGVAYDEVGAYEGRTVNVRKDGEVEADDSDEADDRRKRINEGWLPPASHEIAATIKAEWCPKDLACSWRISANVPHETFDIMEDGELFCRGIVIDFAALK